MEMKKAHVGEVTTAKFCGDDGNIFLTGGFDQVVNLWDTHNANHLGSFYEHEDVVCDVSITGDGSKSCSCDMDGQILYWDLSTRSLIRKFSDPSGQSVASVKFNDFTSAVVSTGFSGVHVWDLRSNGTQPAKTLPYPSSDFPFSIGLRRTEIIVARRSGAVDYLDLRNFTKLCYNFNMPLLHMSMVNGIDAVVVSTKDRTLRLLHVDARTIETCGEYKGATCDMSACCFANNDANNDAHVVGGSDDGNIIIWDMVTAAMVSKFRAHSSFVTSVCYHPKNNCLLTASKDGDVALWKEAL